MELERRVSALKGLLFFIGIGFAVGLPILVVVWPAGFMWEPRQSEYEQMIVGVYMTLGVFLLLASRDPLRHLSLIWFTAWSSLVHGAIMALQAAVDPTEHPNLMGDIPLLLAIGIALVLLTPRARALRGTPAPPA